MKPLARLVRSADFERVLRSASRARTVHFAAHHVPVSVDRAEILPGKLPQSELFTAASSSGTRPVDESLLAVAGEHQRLGAVVPKRHARRAVTRSLLKRQIYAAAGRHRDRLANGWWVVRLRAPFDRTLFTSAASELLRKAAHAELESLFSAATRADRP